MTSAGRYRRHGQPQPVESETAAVLLPAKTQALRRPVWLGTDSSPAKRAAEESHNPKLRLGHFWITEMTDQSLYIQIWASSLVYCELVGFITGACLLPCGATTTKLATSQQRPDAASLLRLFGLGLCGAISVLRIGGAGVRRLMVGDDFILPSLFALPFILSPA